MVETLFSVGRLLLALLLVLLNGFFVASEFAFVRIRSTAVDQLVVEGRTGSVLLQEIVGKLDDYLAVTQLGITISSLGLGWIGEPAVASLIEPLLEPFFSEAAIHFGAFVIGFGVITFLHVVFGELAPKTIAIQRAERISLLVAPPMKFFYYLFIPGIVVFNGTANYFTRLVGVPPASETEETFEEEEILTILSQSGREGTVDAAEVEMIERVFELDDITAREIMVPRPDVVSVPADLPLSELRSLIVTENYTRYPVVGRGDSDQIVGIVDVKDVLRASESDDVDDATSTAGDIAHDIPVVPESGRIDELLAELQDERTQMAAIIDEWGAFEGIVTVEDVLEEIVGDIQDRFDVIGREPSIDERDDGTYVIGGSVSLTRVNRTLNTEFESEEFETVGGLVLNELGRAPEVGDEVSVDDFQLVVDGVDGTRISTVLAHRVDDADPDG